MEDLLRPGSSAWPVEFNHGGKENLMAKLQWHDGSLERDAKQSVNGFFTRAHWQICGERVSGQHRQAASSLQGRGRFLDLVACGTLVMKARERSPGVGRRRAIFKGVQGCYCHAWRPCGEELSRWEGDVTPWCLKAILLPAQRVGTTEIHAPPTLPPLPFPLSEATFPLPAALKSNPSCQASLPLSLLPP